MKTWKGGMPGVGVAALLAVSIFGCSDKDSTAEPTPTRNSKLTVAGPTITQDAFAAVVLTRLEKLRPGMTFVFRKQNFSIDWSKGEYKGVVNLTNAHDEYVAAKPEDRDKQLDHFLSTAANLSLAKNVALSSPEGLRQLMPQVRGLAYRDNMAASLARVGAQPNEYGSELAGHLFVTIVRDLPRTMSFTSDKDLKEAKLTRAAALKRALANLKAKTSARWKQPDPTVKMYESQWKDNYDAARMLLLDLIRAKLVDGDHVVMVPHRDKLLITGSNDVAGLKAMAKSAEASLRGPRPISGVAFILKGDRWHAWLPGPAHGGYNALKMARTVHFIQLYGAQKAQLRKKYKDDKNAPFVAGYRVFQMTKNGPATAIAVVTEGVDTLLPEVDRVMFFLPKETKSKPLRADAPWATVFKVMGKHMRKLDTYPPRYRIRRFPSAAEIRRMGGPPKPRK